MCNQWFMPHPLAGRKQTPEHIAKRVAALRVAKKDKFKQQYAEIDRGYDTRCWIWQMRCSESGYPLYTWTRDNKRTTRKMHRWYYELLVRVVPEGLELDHLCNQRDCVRPAHMEVVTRRENLARRDARREANGGVYHKYGLSGRIIEAA